MISENIKTNYLQGKTFVKKGERMFTAQISVPIPQQKDPYVNMLSHIYVDLLLCGAGNLSRDEYQEAIGKLGGEINIFVADGYIHTEIIALDNVFDKVFSLFKTIVTKPHLKSSELTRIKKQKIQELKISKEDARRESSQMFNAAVYRDNDRRRHYTPDELSKEINNVSLKEILSFHKIAWIGHWIYTAGGNDTVVNSFEKKVSVLRKALPYEDHTLLVHQPLDIVKNQVTLHDIPNKENIEFNIGSPLPLSFSSPDYPALVFGLSVLGIQGGFAGRLMSTVREKEGLTYGIYAGTSGVTHTELGVWKIWTFFAPKDAEKGIASTLKQLELIIKKGISENELVRFKQILHTRLSIIKDSLIKQIGAAHARQLSGVTEEMYTEYLEKIQNLTKEEVNSALKKYLDLKKVIITGAGPITSVKKDIEKFVTK